MEDKKKEKEIISEYQSYLDSQDNLCIDNENILEIMPKLLKLQNEKGLIYGRSWCKYGEFSAFMNCARKWDRIENIMTNAMDNGIDNVLHSDKSSTPTETFLDTVVDLGMYCLMWAGYIKEHYPKEWEKFEKFNKLS